MRSQIVWGIVLALVLLVGGFFLRDFVGDIHIYGGKSEEEIQELLKDAEEWKKERAERREYEDSLLSVIAKGNETNLYLIRKMGERIEDLSPHPERIDLPEDADSVANYLNNAIAKYKTYYEKTNITVPDNHPSFFERLYKPADPTSGGGS